MGNPTPPECNTHWGATALQAGVDPNVVSNSPDLQSLVWPNASSPRPDQCAWCTWQTSRLRNCDDSFGTPGAQEVGYTQPSTDNPKLLCCKIVWPPAVGEQGSDSVGLSMANEDDSIPAAPYIQQAS